MGSKITQSELILSYYKKFPKKPIPHEEVVDWATAEYEKLTGEKFRDPDRSIRKLHQEGILVKLKKGLYTYDPDVVSHPQLEDFTAQQKYQIMKRDGAKCAVCGRGVRDGVELHIDHIKPKDKGGKATVENGQVLCGEHNYRKKNYGQTESGKNMFINLLRLAQSQGNAQMEEFCRDILSVYDEHSINGHINWDSER